MNAQTRITAEAAKVLENITNGMVAAKDADLLDAIRSTAATMAKADRATGKNAIDAGNAIKAAGGDTDANKQVFYLSYLTGYLSLRENAKVTAADILASAGHGRKLSKKQTRARTEVEETAYSAARMAYMRAVRTFTPKESKPRPEGNADATNATGADKVMVAAPGDATPEQVWTGERFNEYVRGQALAMLQTYNRNAATMKGVHPELVAAVVAFKTRCDAADDALETSHK